MSNGTNLVFYKREFKWKDRSKEGILKDFEEI